MRKLVAEVSPPLRPLLHASSAMDQQALEAVLLEQIERLEQTTDSRHQSVGGSGSILSANDPFIVSAMLPMGPLHVAQQESTGFDADAFPCRRSQ